VDRLSCRLISTPGLFFQDRGDLIHKPVGYDWIAVSLLPLAFWEGYPFPIFAGFRLVGDVDAAGRRANKNSSNCHITPIAPSTRPVPPLIQQPGNRPFSPVFDK
jgi:hypothetical protein